MDTKVAECIRSAREHGNLVREAKSILQMLKESGQAVEIRLSPSIVGVHPANRDGLGVSPLDCHALLSDILDIGFSDYIPVAICVEANQAMKDYNAELMRSSGGLLPEFPSVDAIKYGSLSASHTNQLLRMISHGVTHSDVRATIDGKLSIDRLQVVDREMAEACRSGLRWTVLPSSVMDKHPDLAWLIQSAMNSAGQIARAESEMQVLKRVHAAWVMASSGGMRVEYTAIAKRVLASKPPCAPSLPFMFKFMLRASGGQKGDLLGNTERFIKHASPCQKAIGSECWDALSLDIKSSPHQFVLVRHAFLKLAYTTGASAADIKRFATKDNEALCIEVEKLINEMRVMFAGVSDNVDVFLTMGKFEADLARKIIGRNVKSSLEFLAHKLIMDINNITTTSFPSSYEAKCAAEWADHINAIKTKQPVAPPSSVSST